MVEMKTLQLESHPPPVTLKGIVVDPSCNESSGEMLEGNREKGGTGGSSDLVSECVGFALSFLHRLGCGG